MPSSDQVYNNAASMTLDSSTPGLNIILEAWAALQDFVGDWANTAYLDILAVTTDIRSLQ